MLMNTIQGSSFGSLVIESSIAYCSQKDVK